MAKVLLVDDDDDFRSATSELLEVLGHQVTQADSVVSATDILSREGFDRILLDLMLPDGSGLHVLDAMSKNILDMTSIDAQHQASRPKSTLHQATKVTVITGHPAVKSLIKSLYGPRVNYLIKPISLDHLTALFKSDEISVPLKNTSGIKKHLGFLIGESPAMQNLYEIIMRVANTSANVMLMGESGVGKEVVANAIHHISHCEGDFVAANCGAFARELINSELFGHEKGAFTGAISRKAGVFELAQGGTLFLDEITEMPIDLQPNLLRALETNHVTRLGGSTPIPFSCRVVSATNRSESDFSKQNCLREDLYFRLAVFPIKIPSLRERKEDIPLLAKYFLHDLNTEYGTDFKLTKSAIDTLVHYTWPGNVRELRHAMHRAFIMTNPDDTELRLPTTLGSPFDRSMKTQEQKLAVGRTIEEVERELIEVTLEQLDGDKKRAADMLGISLKTLYNRLNDYETLQ